MAGRAYDKTEESTPGLLEQLQPVESKQSNMADLATNKITKCATLRLRKESNLIRDGPRRVAGITLSLSGHPDDTPDVVGGVPAEE